MTTMIHFVDALEIMQRAFGADRGHQFTLDAVYMPIEFKRDGIKYVLEGVPGELDFFYYTASPVAA